MMMMIIRTVTTHLIFMSYQKGRLLSAKQSLPEKKKAKMENMNKTLQYVHVQHLKMTTQTGRMLVA